jgi:glutathione S-transferase
MSPYVLYAMPASLYSAKARSYLRKRRIDYVERANGHPEYRRRVVPEIGRMIIPVLETPSGRLVQDNVDIIELLEREEPGGPPILPPGPCQRAVAHLLELFGGEGLLRPAMHYRWDFDENLPFLEADFGGTLAPAGDPAARRAAFELAAGLMRKATTGVGVAADSIAAIERSYAEFLDLFSAHLREAPYLLGGLPSIGDFGFAGPLRAHLGRDPFPSALMKRTAWPVWRWIERMDSPVADCGEYPDYPEEFFPADEIPATLRALLTYIAAEHVPELRAQVAFADGYLRGEADVSEGSVVGGKASRRAIGRVTFDWRGQELTTNVVPYRLFLLGRMQAAVAAADEEGRRRVRSLFDECGLAPLLELRPRRPVLRRDNHEVWGPEQTPVL